MQDDLLKREREFHDLWAAAIDVEGIHVRDYFEACTAPENRFILKPVSYTHLTLPTICSV